MCRREALKGNTEVELESATLKCVGGVGVRLNTGLVNITNHQGEKVEAT